MVAMTTFWRSLASVATVATLASGSPLLAAEFLEHYKAGLAAVDNQEWERARDLMGRAIEIQPQAKVRIKKALYFKHYLPHYYLGLSLYQMGDCVGALVAWQESTEQRVIERSPEFAQLAAGRETCIQQRSALESSLIEAESLIATAGVAAVRARRDLEALQEKGVEAPGPLHERLQLAESRLDQAKVSLSGADGDSTKLQRTAAQAAQARDDFDFISIESARWLQSVAAQQVEIRATLNQLVVASVQALEGSEYLEPYPPEVADYRRRVETLVARVGQLDTAATNDKLQGLATELERAILALETSTTAPPEELMLAAEAFLGGRYAQVLKVLSTFESESTRAAAQAHLLRAASLFAQSRSQGQEQPELLDQARQQVLYSQSLDETAPNPSPKVFSPRFIEFFEAQRPWFLRRS